MARRISSVAGSSPAGIGEGAVGAGDDHRLADIGRNSIALQQAAAAAKAGTPGVTS